MLQFCPHVPVLMVSAMKQVGFGRIVPLAAQIREECNTRIGTGALNRAMEEVLTKHQPPVVKRCVRDFLSHAGGSGPADLRVLRQ